MVDVSLPKEWANLAQLDGYDFVDKAELVNAPFLIQSIEFYANAHGAHFANVQAVNVKGIPFAFNDSSTGVRSQLLDYVTKLYGEPVDGTVYSVQLVAPRGLRVSVFGITKDNEAVREDDPRAVRKARTYYLTTSGTPKPVDSGREAPTAAETATPLTRGKRK